MYSDDTVADSFQSVWKAFEEDGKIQALSRNGILHVDQSRCYSERTPWEKIMWKHG